MGVTGLRANRHTFWDETTASIKRSAAQQCICQMEMHATIGMPVQELCCQSLHVTRSTLCLVESAGTPALSVQPHLTVGIPSQSLYSTCALMSTCAAPCSFSAASGAARRCCGQPAGDCQGQPDPQ
jgi:hypothetical protein